MVVDLKATLRYTQDDVKILEAENAVVKERLVVSETKVGTLERMLQDTKAEMKIEVDNLKKELAAQDTAHEQELATLKTRLAASEAGIDDLKVENAEREAELTAVETRLDITESEVENLKTEIKAAPKVAFSACLINSGYIEAGNTDLNLVFRKVITNVGEAYSSTTGFFTAPVRGVYYFRFTVMDILNSRNIYIKMFRNGKQLMLLVSVILMDMAPICPVV
ncbi:caprin-2-like [Engraulis encrasicolus]|uniref:caprin-2-like n=1 Tax=Engraulis encrasicolus TaxID=184585 RepID=UPI002FD1A621